MASRSVYLIFCLMLISFFLCGCKTNKEIKQVHTPQTKEERLVAQEWTKDEVIQYYWDHKESLQQIADELMSLDMSVHFYVSGDGYRHDHNGERVALDDDYSSCQTAVDLLEGLDIVSVSYYYQSEFPPASLQINVQDGYTAQGFLYSAGAASHRNGVHIEGDWYYFLEART